MCIYTYMHTFIHICIYVCIYLTFRNLPRSFTFLTKVSFTLASWGHWDRALVAGIDRKSLPLSSLFPLHALLMPKDENAKLALSLGIYEQQARTKHKTI